MAAKTMKHYPISRRPQKPTNRTSIEQDHMHAHTTRYKHTQRTHGLTLTQSLSLFLSVHGHYEIAFSSIIITLSYENLFWYEPTIMNRPHTPRSFSKKCRLNERQNVEKREQAKERTFIQLFFS